MHLLLVHRLVGPGNCARRLTAGLCLFVLCGIAPSLAHAFGWSDVERRARAVANAAYVKPEASLPAELRELSYAQYQNIRFRPDHAHWRGKGLPIELAFFHRGMRFEQPVKINEVTREGVREIRYSADAFDFGANKIPLDKLKGLGFAGFRIHYPVNTPKVKDEVLVFLGASYFRALGRGQVYGLSARGVAVNTGEASGEEFPRFSEFWVVRPLPGAREFTIYALLDSPRLAGAYRFILKPGVETAIEVTARLYPREKIVKLGVAPLSSMYFFGENQRPGHEDYRPEVHDSDGLSVATGEGEWIWRPLVNPKRLLITSFSTRRLAGFGLQQRDRQFSNYEELATRYDARPSVWIEPRGEWGAGRVELVQIPTPDETNDNVMAYWVPETASRKGEPLTLQYRILWQKESESRPPLMWVMQSRRGPDRLHRQDNTIAFNVDFAGGPVSAAPTPRRSPALASDDGALEATTHVDGNATVVSSRIERNEVSGGWRLSLVLRRVDASKPTELRAYLVRDNKPVSETWSYILPPE